MDTQCKQMEDADWLSEVFLDSSNLAKKWLTANELIFAEYCVGSVKFSPVIRGDTGLIEVG